jgi:RNA-directed DNA polymerase
MMDGREKSDRSVVPANQRNKASGEAADVEEGRDLTKGNLLQQNTSRTQSRVVVPSALEQVRQVAVRERKEQFTALLHHVSIDRLKACFLRLNPKAAPGVDQVTWREYGRDLDDNIQNLHSRLHRGAYRAKPSRRAFIPKADGQLRPLGIAALEDKVVQSAMAEVMNAIYESDFLGFSYGFRSGRSPHQALDALATGILRKKVNWVLDADIRGFFDAIDHKWMVKFVQHRIGDKRVLRLIQKWLKAGVMESGRKTRSEFGTPQGATISPLLANIYLHYVFDLWAHQWRRTHARGDVTIVRYADDFVVCFQYAHDAKQFQAELAERLRRFALHLHPEKTRLIQFGRFAAERRAGKGLGKPETFTFLGLRHVCARTRAGKFLLKRNTEAKRLSAKLRAVKGELRRRMHLPIIQQGAWLRAVVTGYFNYHAVPTNLFALECFRTQVARLWWRSLRRRSQRHCLPWKRMNKIVTRWLPKARIVHPWPEERFDVMTRGRSPVR